MADALDSRVSDWVTCAMTLPLRRVPVTTRRRISTSGMRCKQNTLQATIYTKRYSKLRPRIIHTRSATLGARRCGKVQRFTSVVTSVFFFCSLVCLCWPTLPRATCTPTKKKWEKFFKPPLRLIGASVTIQVWKVRNLRASDPLSVFCWLSC